MKALLVLMPRCCQPGLIHKLASLTFSLLQRKLGILIDLANNLLLEQNIPKYNIPLIIKDLASFRLQTTVGKKSFRRVGM